MLDQDHAGPHQRDRTTTQQLELLAAHRRTLAVYLRQQAELGVLAPPGVVNGIETTRAEIRRIKKALRDSGVQVEDEPNDDAPPLVEPIQSQQTGSQQTTINTRGGDYTGRDIDKRQGEVFVEHSTVIGNIIGKQVIHQSAGPSVTDADYRALLAQLWSNARGKLKYADRQRLQAEQTCLELSPQRVQQLEDEVRAILAEERFNEIPASAFECWVAFAVNYIGKKKPQIFPQPFIPSAETMAEIGHCVLLHEDTALRLLLEKWPSKCPVDMNGFKAAFLRANNSQPGEAHYTCYERFLSSLEAGLAKR